jgi:hypothetical protein
MVGLMTNPPKQGEPSYDLYQREMNGIYGKLNYYFLKKETGI